MRTSLIQTRSLGRRFGTRRLGFRSGPDVVAVSGVDLRIAYGEIVGVVGESGSGKSTLGKLVLGLLDPTEGDVTFDGQALADLKGASLRSLRRRLQMVYQDPFNSLDPRRSIGAQVADGLRAHEVVPDSDIAGEVARLLDMVGLDRTAAVRKPHEFSGGQRQRIAIARALASQPDFIVADEPVSALDVSVQAQIVNLIRDLGRKLGLAMMFISHDLHIVRYLTTRTLVMYRGEIVEEGTTEDLFASPRHPYTRALLQATPGLHDDWQQLPPSPRLEAAEPASAAGACPYLARCVDADDTCAARRPRLSGSPGGRRVACLKAG